MSNGIFQAIIAGVGFMILKSIFEQEKLFTKKKLIGFLVFTTSLILFSYIYHIFQ